MSYPSCLDEKKKNTFFNQWTVYEDAILTVPLN